ncbi:hypothetical protein BDZ90DRAFT_233522 [Jaminaea rosea]|uniref:protein-tyrosine-phosphatase n=1 Tax=Jaminaea rosea TaxID=1569628 RepID=A0A316UL09_9BASI|nr:hypothetical protein BDZ90DRAFT_233522 [Jaminaea rosea]PWN25920.1 hypothetical protein BDZ90DRAFT_233522 [Jaminaea rosea]
MDEVLPGLWIGDLACALSPEYLSIAGITHIITALGQRLPAPKSPLPCGRTIPASRCYHVKCDDEESENLLVHFPRVNEVINEALQEQWVKGEQGGEIDEWREATHEWGHWETTGEGTVLVHCQAGCSRSVALVVAYVMATRGIGRDAALELIRARRSQAEPNEGFMEQLDLYERAGCKVDLRHAPIRRFLMSKTDLQRGGRAEDLLVSYFPSPAASPPSSAASSSGRHSSVIPAMSSLDLADGQAAPPGMVRRASRSSVGERSGMALTRSESVDLGVSPAMPKDTDQLFARDQEQLRKDQEEEEQRRRGVNSWATSLSSPHEVLVTKNLAEQQASSSSSVDASSSSSSSRTPFNVPPSSLRGHESAFNRGSLPKPDYVAEGATRLRCRMCRREIAARDHVVEHDVGVGKGAFDVKKRGKDARNEKRSVAVGQSAAGGAAKTMPPDDEAMRALSSGQDQEQQSRQDGEASGTAPMDEDDETTVDGGRRPILQSAASLTASLPPHLAALRAGRAPPGAQVAQDEALRQSRARSGGGGGAAGGGSAALREKLGLGGARARPPGVNGDNSASTTQQDGPSKPASSSRPSLPPLLPSPHCTSYFLEPLSWMSLPTDGSHSSLAGKLLCPNQSCRSKLGSWDWAGVQCACGAWVTPGFAVLRSRVDEVEGSGRTRGEVKSDR